MNEELLTRKQTKKLLLDFAQQGLASKNIIFNALGLNNLPDSYIQRNPNVCIHCKKRYLCLVDLPAVCQDLDLLEKIKTLIGN